MRETRKNPGPGMDRPSAGIEHCFSGDAGVAGGGVSGSVTGVGGVACAGVLSWMWDPGADFQVYGSRRCGRGRVGSWSLELDARLPRAHAGPHGASGLVGGTRPRWDGSGRRWGTARRLPARGSPRCSRPMALRVLRSRRVRWCRRGRCGNPVSGGPRARIWSGRRGRDDACSSGRGRAGGRVGLRGSGARGLVCADTAKAAGSIVGP